MNDIIEQDSQDKETEYKILVGPNFTTLMYELEQYLQYGWAIDEQNYPTANFTLFEIHLYKSNKTIQRAKDRMTRVKEGRDVVSKEKRQEIAAKARAKRKANLENKNAG